MLKERLSKISAVASSFYFFLLPLIALPQLTSNFELVKRIFALFFFAIFLLLLGCKVYLKGEIRLKYNYLTLLLFLFALVLFISSLFSPNKMDSLVFASPYIVSCLLFFIFQNLLSEKEADPAISFIFAGGVFISLFTLLQSLNSKVGIVSPVAPVAISLDQIILNPSFSFIGNLLVQFFYLLIIFPVFIKFYQNTQEKLMKNLALFSLLLLIVGSISTLYNLISIKPFFLDYQNSWRIGINTLSGNFKETLLGVGPGNYSKSFNLYKNINYNNTLGWNMDFNNGHSEILNWLTASGLFGLLSLFLLLYFLFKKLLILKNIYSISLLVFLASAVFFPFNAFLWLFFLPYLALIPPLGKETGFFLLAKEQDNAQKNNRSTIAVIYFLSSLFFFLLLLYFAGRLSFSEYYFAKSLKTTTAPEVFALQNKAVSAYPYSESSYLALSKTNLAITNALSGKKNPSIDDKNIAINHLQLAIDTGKKAVALNPEKKLNLEFMADVYQSLGPDFKGAADFSRDYYNQAIALSPLNPLLYLKRGNLYLSLKDNENALRDFSASINLKPDFLNAHYNLAIVFERIGKYDQALEELKILAKNVAKGSTDAKTVDADIKRVEKLQKNAPISKENNPEGSLPSNLPQFKKEPVLTVDPKASLTPSPFISPTPSPSKAP